MTQALLGYWNPYFYGVYVNTLFTYFLKKGFLKWGVCGHLKRRKKTKKLPNREKSENPKNTNWDQKLTQKSSKKNFFCSVKRAPQDVVQFVPLQSGTENASPKAKKGYRKQPTLQHTYIYIYCHSRNFTPPSLLYMLHDIFITGAMFL